MAKKFIWSANNDQRGWNLVNWEKVTGPKNDRGLGVRVTRLANISLLGKLVWSLVCKKDIIWVNILSHIYITNNTFLSIKDKHGDFFVWQRIIKAKNELSNGFTFLYGMVKPLYGMVIGTIIGISIIWCHAST